MIKNLGLENVNVITDGAGITGGLVGENIGYISRVYVTGRVESGSWIGGLAGVNGGGSSSGTITDCYTDVEVIANHDAGGVTGYNTATLKRAYALGQVKLGEDPTGIYNFGFLSGVNWIETVNVYYPQGAQILNNDNTPVVFTPTDSATAIAVDISAFTAPPASGVKPDEPFKNFDFINTWQFVSGGWPLLKLDLISSVANPAGNIASFELDQNYPNPFNPTTTINYSLRKSLHVKLEIYNALGQKVRTLVNGVQPSGTHKAVWDGSDDLGRSLASAIYVYRLESEDFAKTQKMLLVK